MLLFFALPLQVKAWSKIKTKTRNKTTLVNKIMMFIPAIIIYNLCIVSLTMSAIFFKTLPPKIFNIFNKYWANKKVSLRKICLCDIPVYTSFLTV